MNSLWTFPVPESKVPALVIWIQDSMDILYQAFQTKQVGEKEGKTHLCQRDNLKLIAVIVNLQT